MHRVFPNSYYVETWLLRESLWGFKANKIKKPIQAVSEPDAEISDVAWH